MPPAQLLCLKSQYYTYGATPNGIVAPSNYGVDTLFPLASLINTTENVMRCTVTYGIETSGNMLTTAQNLDSETVLNLVLGETYNKNNFPTQVTTNVIIKPYAFQNVNSALTLRRCSNTNNISSLNGTDIQIDYTTLSMSCLIYNGSNAEIGDINIGHGGGTVLPFDPIGGNIS